MKNIALGIICFSALQLHAQTGSISGKITDDKKQPIADAIVVASQNNVPVGGTTTDKEGKYTIKSLHTGSYDVKARKMEYGARLNSYINVAADKITPLDFTLYLKSPNSQPVKVH